MGGPPCFRYAGGNTYFFAAMLYLDCYIAGKLFPYHFVRPQDKDTVSRFCEDLNTKRLSVITPFEHLQKSECV